MRPHIWGYYMDLIIKARAKINLALEITGAREDGYHDLRTVMQSLYLHDRLALRRLARPHLKLVCSAACLPVDERNLVYKTAQYFKKAYNLPGGLFMSLRKEIPVSAGLAGGSSDCAAAMLGINRLYGLRLTQKELMETGAKFGADVPFCILGGTALAEGKGEILTQLPPHPPVSVIIAKPPVSLSTASVFKAYDNIKHTQKKQNIEIIISNIKKRDLRGITSGFYNALEDVSIDLCPDIAKLKGLYMESGAAGALMSGSGPSVFAYFSDQRRAWRAMKHIGLVMPHIKQYLTGTFNDPGQGGSI